MPLSRRCSAPTFSRPRSPRSSLANRPICPTRSNLGVCSWRDWWPGRGPSSETISPPRFSPNDRSSTSGWTAASAVYPSSTTSRRWTRPTRSSSTIRRSSSLSSRRKGTWTFSSFVASIRISTVYPLPPPPPPPPRCSTNSRNPRSNSSFRLACSWSWAISSRSSIFRSKRGCSPRFFYLSHSWRAKMRVASASTCSISRRRSWIRLKERPVDGRSIRSSVRIANLESWRTCCARSSSSCCTWTGTDPRSPCSTSTSGSLCSRTWAARCPWTRTPTRRRSSAQVVCHEHPANRPVSDSLRKRSTRTTSLAMAAASPLFLHPDSSPSWPTTTSICQLAHLQRTLPRSRFSSFAGTDFSPSRCVTAVSSICSAMNCCFYGKNDKYVRKRIDYGGRKN